MRRPLKLASALAGLTLLASCSAASEPVETPTPTPVAEAATPEQVASVIARYEPEWRETIAGSFECTVHYVLGSEIGEDAACYTADREMAVTIREASDAFLAMEIPDSMLDLVSPFYVMPPYFDEAKLLEICGDDRVPNMTDECNAEIGQRYGYYDELDSQLNAWSPYL